MQLPDGTWVRYFTLPQSVELAERLAEGEQCSEHLSLIEQQLELRETQVVELNEAVDIAQRHIEIQSTYISSVDATVEQLFDRLERKQRFLFCSGPACTYSIGFVFGIGTAIAISFAVN